jgi:hypothetical protein
LQNLHSIYQLSFDFVKQLFRIQIQKGGKVLLWNQVKSRMEAYYSELILVLSVSNGVKTLSTISENKVGDIKKGQ